MPKISVVIPVYNNERYVERCIQSVLHQSFEDIEVIIVDDGSKDSSLKLCESLSASDARLRVFSKANGGASSARAFGVDRAIGDFICFVDSDDMIPQNSLLLMCKYLDEGNLDIIQCARRFHPYGNRDVIITGFPHIGLYSNIDFVRFLLEDKCNGGPVGGLYKRSLFSEKTFNLPHDVKLKEDLYMNVCLGLNAKKIGLYNDVVYDYYENTASVTHNYPFISILPQQHLLDAIKRELLRSGFFDEVSSAYYSLAINFVASACFHNKKLLSDKYVKELGLAARSQVVLWKDKLLCMMLIYPQTYYIFYWINELRKKIAEWK